MESNVYQIHGCKHKEPDGQRDHTKDEAGHNGVLSASHCIAISEIPNQHLMCKCDVELSDLISMHYALGISPSNTPHSFCHTGSTPHWMPVHLKGANCTPSHPIVIYLANHQIRV